ncbi:MAG: alkyl hydroperoxide reductase [Gemmatimonadetes bacterium]|nr:alkyl hydroperoxide reductase [Gemmatimonadota bacterium]MEC7846964.1 TlpA disulfide reductase family protein [Gemmatimonadota bacterium]MED5198821.1 TlpA disulfide reductase family protein [Gemmatimonadota bacterium]MED5564834.1 TlpA disulfide reductase family protein [Gemmatimonadota bacterium]MEE3185225.1 TlpA disulfide reductase family protein [Gemmatimonadota bacterium]|tara:strand:+ start:44 stop:559 length:516 start_codon:yes stop_codon:yes gene_type:complete
MSPAVRATLALLFWVSACAPSDLPSPPQVGDQAPEFQATSLDGTRTVALADYAGQTTLVNLWATWCAPCRFETPYLQAVYEENQDRGLMIVGVSVDSPSALDQVNDFLEEMGVTYDILLDPGMVSTDSFMPQGYPTSYLIDGEGVIRFARIGPIPEGDAEFLEALEQTLGG